MTLTHQEGGWQYSCMAVADADGRFAFLDAPTGSVQVHAVGQDGSKGQRRCRLVPGRSEIADIVLGAVPRGIAGRVRMEGGTPCVGWRVGATLPGESRLWLDSHRTEEGGYFQLLVSGPDLVDVEVYAPAGSLWPAVVRRGLKPPLEEVEITVPETALALGGIAGTVLPPQGVLLEDLWLTVEVEGKLDRRTIEIDLETGAFVSDEIPAGRARLHLVGPTVFELFTDWMPVGEGANRGERTEWILEPTAAGRVRLTALLAGAECRKPLHAELYDPAGTHVESLSQVGSLLRSKRLRSGEYRLLVWGKEIALRESWIYVDAPQVYEERLLLEPGTTRSLLLEGVDCPREGYLRFELLRDGELLRKGAVQGRSRLTLEGLEVVRYEVVLYCAEYAVWRAHVEVSSLADQGPIPIAFARDP